jgi:hypothetical protein
MTADLKSVDQLARKLEGKPEATSLVMQIMESNAAMSAHISNLVQSALEAENERLLAEVEWLERKLSRIQKRIGWLMGETYYEGVPE